LVNLISKSAADDTDIAGPQASYRKLHESGSLNPATARPDFHFYGRQLNYDHGSYVGPAPSYAKAQGLETANDKTPDDQHCLNKVTQAADLTRLNAAQHRQDQLEILKKTLRGE